MRALTAGADANASAEAANASPLKDLWDFINGSTATLTGRPPTGDGASAGAGTGQNGLPGGWLLGHGGAAGRTRSEKAARPDKTEVAVGQPDCSVPVAPAGPAGLP